MLLITTFLLCGWFTSLAAQETVFRFDGQIGRDGKAQLAVPVTDGQQLIFRVASLDFTPRVRISLNGLELAAENEGQSLAVRFVHVRKPGTALVSIDSGLAAGSPTGTFQLRVQRIRDNPPLSRPALQKGAITSSDQREGKGRYVDWYPLAVTKGQRLLIGVSSRLGDAALRLELPDGSNLENDDAVGSDARLQVEISESGTAWIGAAILLPDAAPRDDLNIPYQVYVRDYNLVNRPLVLGQTGPVTPFQLIAEDVPPVPESHTFTAPKAGVYRFRLEGKDGALPVLHARLDSGRQFAGSFSQAMSDQDQIRCYLRNQQRIDFISDSLPVPGRPQYSLSVVYDGPGIALRDGENQEKSIADSRQGFFVYRGRAGEYAEFLMTSDDFETRLVASDQAGQLFSWSKFYGSEFSYASQGGYWFEQAGDLLLETASRNPGDEGLYQISVRSSLSDNLNLPREPAPRTLLASGAPVYARITDRHTAVKGGYADEYSLDLKAADLVTLRLQSWDLEPRLEVLSPEGLELVGSGGAASKDNTVELLATRGGRYVIRVIVDQYEGQSLNATYTLTPDVLGNLHSLDADLVGKTLDMPPTPERPGSEAPWLDIPLRLRSTQRIYLIVESNDFRPIIKLLDKDGIVIEENHGNAQRGWARIDLTILKGGPYRLRVVRGPALISAVAPGLRCTVSAYEVR